MSADLRIESGHGARPVADAPIEALLAKADELARRWAIALIGARPLERIGELPLEQLAREAPLLCAQLVRALASDVELERLAGGTTGAVDSPAATLGVLAGAPSAQAAVAAAEALRGVLWEAILEELRWPGFDWRGARRAADLGDRLAFVCASALAATLAEGSAVLVRSASPAPGGGGREEIVYSAERPTHARHGIRVVDEREALTPTSRPWPRGEASHARPGVHADRAAADTPRPSPDSLRAQRGEDPARGSRAQPDPDARPTAGHERIRARPRPWDIPLRAERSEGRQSPQSDGPQSDAWISDSAVEGDDRVMRISRRSGRSVAPADEPA